MATESTDSDIVLEKMNGSASYNPEVNPDNSGEEIPEVNSDTLNSNPTFSGSTWLETVKEDLDANPGEWRPVTGAENKFLELKDLVIGGRFASGASGRLYYGTYHGEEVAVKILRNAINDQDREKLDAEFKQEVSLLNSVDHGNIVKFIGACCKDNAWCMATEYLGGGNLKNFLREREDNLSWTMVADFATDIAKAMEYLHSREIIHRDLKSDNMVFTSDGVLKLTDFGISRKTNKGGEMTAEMGTFRWMAPEVIDHMPYTEKIDTYSFGIVLWEIISREQPFADMTPIQAAFAVVSKNARPPVPEGTLRDFGELMEKCWHQRPEKRPSFQEITQILGSLKHELVVNPEALRIFKPVKSTDGIHHSYSHTGGSNPQGGCCVIL